MPWGVAAAAAIGIGGSMGGSFLGSSGAKKQKAQMQAALEYQKQIDKRNYDYQKGIDERTYGDFAPYRTFGRNSLAGLERFLANKDPSNYIDPGYAFRLKGGSDAITGNAAANGLLQSGDTLRALTEYGQNMGSQEYGNAFNRWLGEGQFRQGLAGMGQQAALYGGQLANQGAANLMQSGNQAAANVGQITANTDFGASDRSWANGLTGSTGMVSGLLGGMSGGMGGSGGSMFGGSNIFSGMFGGQKNSGTRGVPMDINNMMLY